MRELKTGLIKFNLFWWRILPYQKQKNSEAATQDLAGRQARAAVRKEEQPGEHNFDQVFRAEHADILPNEVVQPA